MTFLLRLAIAFLVGLVVVGALAVYLTRRITRPVLALSDAADRIAEGKYDVEVPQVPGGGEIGHLADRFREMATRLAEAEELERNFLMSVSHELRTPLTAIRGHVAALRDGVVTDPEAAEESLEIIAEEAERLGRLVNDVLDLAKLDAHRFTVLTEEVDMSRLCDRAYSTFSEEARRRGIEYTQEAEGAPVIVSDGDRVLQIISNLLSNAFRWTPDGGRIDLELASDNGTVTVDIADTGPGIRQEERERIFRPFWSRTVAAPGSGCRSRESLRWRSAAGSSCRPSRGRAAASGSSCRSGGASPRLGARRTAGCSAAACSTMARSTFSSRASTPFQPDETRSTSRARSSMRAWRSASRSPSSRSSRRIAWFSRPRISAM